MLKVWETMSSHWQVTRDKWRMELFEESRIETPEKKPTDSGSILNSEFCPNENLPSSLFLWLCGMDVENAIHKSSVCGMIARHDKVVSCLH